MQKAAVIQGVSKYMQPIKMRMTFYLDKDNGGHSEHVQSY